MHNHHSTEKREDGSSHEVSDDIPDAMPDGQKRQSVLHVLATYLAACLLAMLVWLDEGIVATAIPSISNQFDALSDIGWYGSSYLFALCSFQLPFGKLFRDFDVKVSFLGCVLLFEIGSIIQASAPTSAAFIVGRCIAGIGGAGILTGALVIFNETLPPKWITFAMGSLGWVYGVGVVAGPILGGAITKSHLTWRWCFWINPIISCPFAALVLLVVRVPDKSRRRGPLLPRLASFDVVGSALFIPAIVCFLAALQIGSSERSWSDWRTIVLFVAAAALFIAFCVWQWRQGDQAMLPIRLVTSRTIVCAMIYTATFDGGFFILVYYLPLWFQAVKGLSALESAVHTISFIGPVVIAIFVSGAVVAKLEITAPSMLVASAIFTIGAGLLTTWHPDSSTATWLGYQILAGIGVGFGTQLPLLTAQGAVEEPDVPTALSLVLTCGYLGSSIGVTIAESVFASRLKHLLASSLPQDRLLAFVQAGATSFRTLAKPTELQPAVEAFNGAVTSTFYISVVFAGLSFLTACCLRWEKPHPPAVDEGAS